MKVNFKYIANIFIRRLEEGEIGEKKKYHSTIEFTLYEIYSNC